MNAQYAWFNWSLLSLVIWAGIYLSLKGADSRREMWKVSLWTSFLGLTEPLFVPEYWLPPSLFDLALKTGFDIESLIFSWSIGGIAVVIYEKIFRASHRTVSGAERHDPRHRIHFWAVISAPTIFIFLLVATQLNPIYSAIIAMMGGGFFAWYCRPDLKKKMLVSALIFLGLYAVYFKTLIVVYPGYIERVWNFSDISGILISGIPLEELLFAVSFGFIWSSIYEHFTWRKIVGTHV